MLLHAPSYIVQTHWSKILSTVEWLLAIQDPLGNWPIKAGCHMPLIPGGAAVQEDTKRLGIDEETGTALVHWCHGAPGFLILFSALLRRASSSPAAYPLPPALHATLLAATARAAELVYTRGFLRKGVGLCHGVAGSVFALLAASSALDPPRSPPPSPPSAPHSLPARALSLHRPHIHTPPIEAGYWLQRAAHLADLAVSYPERTQQGHMRTPDHPYSLYEGLAGMCCAWSEVFLRLGGHGGKDKEGAANHGVRVFGMPGYDDLAMLE